MSELKTIHRTEEVTPECLVAAEEVYEGFFSHDDQIDWESFWDRLEKWGYEVGSLDCGATRKIQRHIRKFRNEG
jgi:hypothetical protein